MFSKEKGANFKAKGLGWIPDYPDARDYQLSNEIFEKLGKVTGQEYFKGVNLLLKQLKQRLSRLPVEDTDLTDYSTDILNYLEQELEKFDFPEVKVYRVLRSGSVGKEVTLLKYCLTRFYQKVLEPLNVKEPQPASQCSAQKAVQYLCNHLEDELDFLDKPQENWKWLSQTTFDEPGTNKTEILVKVFQTWAQLEPIDGIVGLETYVALENWMVQPEFEQEHCFTESVEPTAQKFSLPIPFPAPIPSNLLQTTLKKLLLQNEEKLWQNHTFEKDVEDIAQEYFLIIEPVIFVITEILGPVGAYQNIEAAIESAVGKFLFLLNLETESQLDELFHLPNLARVSSSEKFERFQLPKDIEQTVTVLDLKFLGSSEKLPDHLVSELREDLNNLKYLREAARKAINTCRDRLKKEELDRDSSIYKILSIISKLRKQKDTEKDIFSKSVVLELVPKPSILDKIKPKESHSTTANSSVGTDNESTQFFSDYRVPSGANLLRNLRNEWENHLKKVEKDTSKDWKDCWKKNTNSIKVFTYLPDSVDLSFWCSPVSDQGTIKSCSAHAGAALVEYFSKRYLNDYKPVSTRFLYKIARNLMERKGDTGASLRETIKAMVTFGIPPEAYWRYEEANFDEEPTSFCYSFAQNYQTLSYFRLDHPNVVSHELLTRIKIALAAGFPCMFGFTIHKSIYDSFNVKRGYIPYPGKPPQNLTQPDEVISGHAVVAVGYHDYKQIKHSNSDDFSTGALLIRNSWGTQWGLSGYGWLPYDYVLNGLTADWWSLVESKWLETGKFGLGGTKDYGEVNTGQKGK
jgi:C1A family cysteine protease